MTKYKSTVLRCRELLQDLNVNWGRGSIDVVRLHLDGTGTFRQRVRVSHHRFENPGRRLKFHIKQHSDGRLTVFALGHQRTRSKHD